MENFNKLYVAVPSRSFSFKCTSPTIYPQNIVYVFLVYHITGTFLSHHIFLHLTIVTTPNPTETFFRS